MTIIDDHKIEFDKLVGFFKEELGTLRTGRANPAMVDKVMVEAYGSTMPLIQTATINLADAKSMTIEPWDKSILKDIEKSLIAANLGLGIVNEGNMIRLTVPMMTEENRKELVKQLGQKAEKTKINVRGLRDKVRDQIEQLEDKNEITEDDRYKLQEDLDELVKKYNEQIKEIADKKEQEIMTV